MALENEISQSQTEMVIECSEGLDASLVTDFKALLKQAANQDLPIVIDATNLERIDASALQLISAFFAEAKEAGLKVSWRNPSEPLRYAAELTGLKEALHL